MGASLSADVPLTSILEHMFLSCQGYLDFCGVGALRGTGMGSAGPASPCGVPLPHW